MFYSTQVLCKRGPLGLYWIAAHSLDGRLLRQQIYSADISSSVDTIINPEAPLALRLSGQLLLGVVRVYTRKVNYLFDDCTDALTKLKKVYKAQTVDLPDGASTAPVDSITLTFDTEQPIFGEPLLELSEAEDGDHRSLSRAPSFMVAEDVGELLRGKSNHLLPDDIESTPTRSLAPDAPEVLRRAEARDARNVMMGPSPGSTPGGSRTPRSRRRSLLLSRVGSPLPAFPAEEEVDEVAPVPGLGDMDLDLDALLPVPHAEGLHDDMPMEDAPPVPATQDTELPSPPPEGVVAPAEREPSPPAVLLPSPDLAADFPDDLPPPAARRRAPRAAPASRKRRKVKVDIRDGQPATERPSAAIRSLLNDRAPLLKHSRTCLARGSGGVGCEDPETLLYEAPAAAAAWAPALQALLQEAQPRARPAGRRVEATPEAEGTPCPGPGFTPVQPEEAGVGDEDNGRSPDRPAAPASPPPDDVLPDDAPMGEDEILQEDLAPTLPPEPHVDGGEVLTPGSPVAPAEFFERLDDEDLAEETESQAVVSGDGFTARTRAVLGRVTRAGEGSDAATVRASAITEGRTRGDAARCFFELLVLKCKGIVELEQAEAWGDIDVTTTGDQALALAAAR